MEILVVKPLPLLTTIALLEDNRISLEYDAACYTQPSHTLNPKLLLCSGANSKSLENGSWNTPTMWSLLPSGLNLHLFNTL